MSSLRARVINGRLRLDTATSLPEGTVLDLVVDDEGDDLDESDRAALNSAISRAWASVQAGQGQTIDAWWQTNRASAPKLFIGELAEALVRLLARGADDGKSRRFYSTYNDLRLISATSFASNIASVANIAFVSCVQ
jgi:hypothetical protein